MAEATGQAHGRLSHLDVPRHLGPGPVLVGTQPESGHTGEVPADCGIDGVRAHALAELDAEAHAIGQGWSDNAAQHRTPAEPVALELALGEPGPPALELVDLLDPLPQLLRRQIEVKAVSVDDHRCRHALTLRAMRRCAGGTGHGPFPIVLVRNPHLPAHQVTTRNLGAAYPFIAEAGLGRRGVVIGDDLLGGSFVFDPFELYAAGVVSNPNIVVFGQIGRGKSAFVKTFLWRQAVFGRRAWVVDPKGEYGDLADAWGVRPVALRPGGAIRLNPLDPGPDDGGTGPDATGRRRMELLASLASACLGRSLVPRERAALGAALLEAGEAHGAPTVPMVVESLLSPSEGAARSLRTERRSLLEDGRDVALELRRLVHGDLCGMFDGPTTPGLDLSAPLVVLDLSALYSSAALGVLMACATAWLQAALARTAVTSGAAPTGRGQFFLVVDEAWAILSNDSIGKTLYNGLMTSTHAKRAPEATVAAGIYARISKDDAGDLLGVKRQEKDARALCARKGWGVARVFIDDDVSAWSGRRRPAYEDMLKAIESGEITAVAVYDLDRLHRQPRDLERFFDVCDRAGVKDLASVAGDADLGTSDGKLLARIMGAAAAKSSDDTSRRIKRKLEDVAAEGRAHGGHRRFGYTPDGMTIVPAEAKLLKTAASDVLAGATLNEIACRWNEAGIPTPQKPGALWSGTQIKQVLTGAHQAGLRRHRGEIVGKGNWPAIFSRAEHERIAAALDGKRVRNPVRSSLLTGLVICGRCGEKMTRNGTQPNGSRGHVGTWRCAKRPGYKNCGQMSVTATPLEELITETVLQLLDGPALSAVLKTSSTTRQDDKAANDLAKAEARLAELAEMFGTGEITKAEWMTARSPIEDQINEARSHLHRKEQSAVLKGYAKPGSLRASWPDMTVDRRRAVIAAVIESIIVNASARRGPVFDDARVDVKWADER
jgi:site-specific DNA recombinase